MKKSLIILMVLIPILAFSLMGLPNLPVMAQTTIYVDASNTIGPWDGTESNPYQYIQNGIDASSTGDIVHVAGGTYYEHITLKDGVQLLGSGAELTTLNGSASGRVILAIDVGNGAKIDGFTITNGRVDPTIGGDGAGLAIYGGVI